MPSIRRLRGTRRGVTTLVHGQDDRVTVLDNRSLQGESSSMARPVPFSIAQRMLESVLAVGNQHTGLAERRQAFLVELGDLIDADAGWWSWGRGRPDSSTVAPVATIDFGFNHDQRTLVREWALDRESDRTFQQPILRTMRGASQITTLRCDIFSDAEWETTPAMRGMLARAGWDDWIHSVRYSSNDTWSNFFLARQIGKPDFGEEESVALDLAMSGVSWMHSSIEESLPPETFVGLTPRQRIVMLMLLDGAARKTIARQLRITEDTVGDHIKSIYSHFRVGSASELAALFLRAR
jgi:DNA-binding CsgD family transcriptional regulator